MPLVACRLSLVACRLSLVACRLSLVACRLSQKLWRRASACQVLLQNFLHFFCENDCNCGQCVFLSLVYSIARFFISFNVFGKVFFNLTAKIQRAQRNFDEVLMTYSLNLPFAHFERKLNALRSLRFIVRMRTKKLNQSLYLSNLGAAYNLLSGITTG